MYVVQLVETDMDTEGQTAATMWVISDEMVLKIHELLGQPNSSVLVNTQQLLASGKKLGEDGDAVIMEP